MLGTEAAPFAFVSSLTKEHKQLRLDLFALGRELKRYVWVCEHKACRPDLKPGTCSPLEIADTLLDRVRASQLYILILGGSRHGTPLQVDGHEASVSHLETEIFQAALHGKRVELFIVQGFAPDQRLDALLEILKWALPRECWRRALPKDEILREVRTLLTAIPPAGEGKPAGWDYGLRSRLIARFHQQRHPRPDRDFLFLDGRHEPRISRPNLDLVRALSVELEQPINQERRLIRIWLMIRELMAAPYTDPNFAEYRPHWNRALELWEGASAWYGLHAHIYLGSRAAVGSMAQVRGFLRESPPKGKSARDFPPPATGLASATYSIAKLAPWPLRLQLFDEALNHLKFEPDTPAMRSDVLALRGSILLRTYRPSEAVEAYEETWRIRQRLGWPADRIGDSMSELGFACFLAGNFWRGRELLLASQDLLEGGGIGFRIRSKKKLAWALQLTGRFQDARRERAAAHELALAHRMFDQL
ncbi:MAG TPA: hypothetical protein VIO38_13310 [Rariglobus sp.]